MTEEIDRMYMSRKNIKLSDDKRTVFLNLTGTGDFKLVRDSKKRFHTFKVMHKASGVVASFSDFEYAVTTRMNSLLNLRGIDIGIIADKHLEFGETNKMPIVERVVYADWVN